MPETRNRAPVVVSVMVGEVLVLPIVIVPSADMPFPPFPELLQVRVPPVTFRFADAVKQDALYESFTPEEFTYVVPVPEQIMFTVPELMFILPSAEMPFPAAPVLLMVMLAPAISTLVFPLIAVQ